MCENGCNQQKSNEFIQTKSAASFIKISLIQKSSEQCANFYQFTYVGLTKILPCVNLTHSFFFKFQNPLLLKSLLYSSKDCLVWVVNGFPMAKSHFLSATVWRLDNIFTHMSFNAEMTVSMFYRLAFEVSSLLLHFEWVNWRAKRVNFCFLSLHKLPFLLNRPFVHLSF